MSAQGSPKSNGVGHYTLGQQQTVETIATANDQHARCARGYWLPDQELTGALGQSATHVLPADWEENAEESGVEGIRVHLERGHGLIGRGKAKQLCDPFVTLTIRDIGKSAVHSDKVSWTSRTVRNSTNPLWFEEAFLRVRDFHNAVLVVEVYDKQRSARLSKPVFIGGSTLDLSPNKLKIHGRTSEVRLPLTDTKCDLRKESKLPTRLGDIALHLERGTETRKLTRRTSNAKARREVHELVTVDILRARGIPSMDSNGLADPFVSLALGESKRKTRVRYKTLEPEWLARYEFHVRQDPILRLSVYDYDVVGSNDFIGQCSMDVSDRKAFPRDQTTVAWFPLIRPEVDDSLGITFGEIEVAITTVDMFDDSKTKGSDDLPQLAHNAELHIRISQAKALPVFDASGSSDPYAVIEVENTRVRTATVHKSLFPKWKREFVIPVRDVWQPLKVDVYDEDDGGKDNQFMGGVLLNMNKLSKTGKARWYALKKSNYTVGLDGGSQIEIEARLIWKPKCYSALLAPKQKNYLTKDEEFKFSLLNKNVRRFTSGVGSVTYAMDSIVGLIEWRFGFTPSFLTLVIWWKIFLFGETVTSDICFVLAALYAYRGFLYSKAPKEVGIGELPTPEEEEFDSDDDGEVKSKGKGQSKSLMARYKAMMELAENANTIIDEWATIGERWKNVFKWKAKFISLFFCGILLLLSFLLWLVQGHFNLVMFVAGTFKITKMGLIKYGYMKRKPKHLRRGLWFLNAVKRVPSDLEIDQCRRLRSVTGPNRPQSAAGSPKKDK